MQPLLQLRGLLGRNAVLPFPHGTRDSQKGVAMNSLSSRDFALFITSFLVLILGLFYIGLIVEMEISSNVSALKVIYYVYFSDSSVTYIMGRDGWPVNINPGGFEGAFFTVGLMMTMIILVTGIVLFVAAIVMIIPHPSRVRQAFGLILTGLPAALLLRFLVRYFFETTSPLERISEMSPYILLFVLLAAHFSAILLVLLEQRKHSS